MMDDGLSDPGASLGVPPMTVTCIGDSITAGSDDIGGFRTKLYVLFGSEYHVKFTGTQTTNHGPGKHKGYPGAGVLTLMNGVSSANPTTWVDQFAIFGEPDLAFILLGANGFDSADYSTMVNQVIAAGSKVKVICSSLFLRTDSAGNETSRLAFNAAIKTAIEADPLFNTRIFLNESLATALVADDLADGLHPTTAGYAKVATNLYQFAASKGLQRP